MHHASMNTCQSEGSLPNNADTAQRVLNYQVVTQNLENTRTLTNTALDPTKYHMHFNASLHCGSLACTTKISHLKKWRPPVFVTVYG